MHLHWKNDYPKQHVSDSWGDGLAPNSWWAIINEIMMAQSIGSLGRQSNVGQNLLHQLFICWWHNFTCMPSIVAHFYLMTQIYRSLNCRYPLILTHVQYLKCLTTDNLAFENWYLCIFCARQNVQLISIKEYLIITSMWDQSQRRYL